MVREAKNNILKFNEYLSDQMITLASRGASSSDIIINLFSGYKSCTNKKFIECMDKCKDSYEEGEDLTYRTLMSKTERKYQARVMRNQWNTLSNEQEQIVALKAQLTSINSFKQKKVYPTKTKKLNKRSEVPLHPKQKLNGAHAWRNKKPLPHEPNTKVVNGGTWHYCSHHNAWGRHTTKSCLKANLERNRTNNYMHLPAINNNLHVAMADLGIDDITINSDSKTE
jgi:hypothetical protein